MSQENTRGKERDFDSGGGCAVININKPELWSEVLVRIRKMSPDDRRLALEMLHLASTSEDSEEAEEAMSTFLEVFVDYEVKDARPQIVGFPLEESKVPQKLDKWRRYVAKQIQSMRNKLGLTQQQLASKADINQPHLSRIENAEVSPSYKTISKLARALGVEHNQIDPSV